MELGVIGLVTAEGTTRVWTREGSIDLEVAEPERLRALLGEHRVDNEPMLPGGVRAEMVLLDPEQRTLLVSAPFRPEDGQIFPLGPAFRVRPARKSEWTDETLELLASWLASRVDSALQHDKALHIFERDAYEQGRRSVQCSLLPDGQGWCVEVGTNAPPRDNEGWAQAPSRDGIARLRLPRDTAVGRGAALLAMMTVASWPGSPLDLVLGWSALGAVDEIPLPQAGQSRNTSTTVRKRRGDHIDALHIPHDAAPRIVAVNRRDVTHWYPHLHGGPVDYVPLTIPGKDDHEVYVNARYADFDGSMVNVLATALLESRGIGMFLGHMRGDALLVRAPGRAEYPRP